MTLGKPAAAERKARRERGSNITGSTTATVKTEEHVGVSNSVQAAECMFMTGRTSVTNMDCCKGDKKSISLSEWTFNCRDSAVEVVVVVEVAGAVNIVCRLHSTHVALSLRD